jgi:hypothetical protein
MKKLPLANAFSLTDGGLARNDRNPSFPAALASRPLSL